MMASIFGINPVSGGKPANEINNVEINIWEDGEIIVIFLSCFEVVKFIILKNINNGIISEQ